MERNDNEVEVEIRDYMVKKRRNLDFLILEI